LHQRRHPRPLGSYLVYSGHPLQGDAYEPIEGEIARRFSLPITRLASLPGYLSEQIFYIKIDEPKGTPDDYWNEEEIAFAALSQIKYVGTIQTIHIATFLMSPAAFSLFQLFL
jgi:hypothetical protein